MHALDATSPIPPWRILIVDDAAVIRTFVTALVQSDPACRVVSTAANGDQALDIVRNTECDVILLDVDMPGTDGITLIPQLLAVQPEVSIIMLSSLTRKHSEVTLKALRAGALDYLTKPSAAEGATFQAILLDKLHSFAALTRQRRARRNAPVIPAQMPPLAQPASHVAAPITAIAIGASTGGPQVLFTLLKALHNAVPQPVFITQHMPASFTPILAQHIAQHTGWRAVEAKDGMIVEGATAYIAPGGKHLTVLRQDGRPRITISDAPPQGHNKPSIDTMLESLTALYGAGVLAVMLTGMGDDGVAACHNLARRHGTILAQDEGSSAVWGFAGLVAKAGLCREVAPPAQLAVTIKRLAGV